jgi:hypothetical protein
MTAVNILALSFLQGQYPGVSTAYLEACVSQLVASVQEPLTSNLLPAVIGLVLV